MSSSNRMPPMLATPWALEELASTDMLALSLDALAHDRSFDHHGERHESYTHEPTSTGVDAATAAAANAYAQGVADGEAAARHHADTQLSLALRALAAAAESVRIHEARWTANAEENIAALAIVVARHLVQREVEADHAIVHDLVRRALLAFPIDQVVSVRLHPDDVAACGTASAPDKAGRVQDVRWIADPHIQRGGCLVEGRDRIVDGRIDTSLERAYRTIGQVEAS